MAFIQRLLLVGLIPILALVSLQLLCPEGLSDTFNLIRSYLVSTPLQEISSRSLDRSETPLIISAFTHWSHYEKIAKVAVVLAELGYPITFITGRLFEKETTQLHPNITYHPLLGEADKLSPDDYATLASLPPGSPEANLFLSKVALVDGMPATHETLQQVFRDFRGRYGTSKPLLSLYDLVVVGHIPSLLGAPGLKPDVSIAISNHPISLDSNDTYPFHMDKLPETSTSAREIHWKAYQRRHEHYHTRELDLYWWAKLRDLGVVREEIPTILHAMSSLPDHLLTLGIPEFEYPRSDIRGNVHYFGALRETKKSISAKTSLPSWWDDVTRAKKEGKKIVAVSQGTVETNLNDLLLPTLSALKNRNDVLVVASTVVVEPEDVPDLILPGNARAAKFVPYDILLPLTDVLVSNGGYGAVMTALNFGIPMVVAGTGQDKGTTNNLIQWTGVGLNLGGKSPGIDKVREGVNKVLDDVTFKNSAVQMSRNFERYDLAQVFDEVIQGAVKKWKREVCSY